MHYSERLPKELMIDFGREWKDEQNHNTRWYLETKCVYVFLVIVLFDMMNKMVKIFHCKLDQNEIIIENTDFGILTHVRSCCLDNN